MGSSSLMGAELQCGIMEMLWRWIVAISAQHGKLFNGTELYTLIIIQIVYFMLRIFCHTKEVERL